MARKLAASTIKRLKAKLVAEKERLEGVIAEVDRQREEIRLTETGSEHNVDPDNMDGGSLAFEMEMEASVQANAMELLEKVNRALGRIEDGTYGICEVSGEPIPVARLEALPYATTTVENAGKI